MVDRDGAGLSRRSRTATVRTLYRREVVGMARQNPENGREGINFNRLKCEISKLRSGANVSSLTEKQLDDNDAIIQLHT